MNWVLLVHRRESLIMHFFVDITIKHNNLTIADKFHTFGTCVLLTVDQVEWRNASITLLYTDAFNFYQWILHLFSLPWTLVLMDLHLISHYRILKYGFVCSHRRLLDFLNQRFLLENLFRVLQDLDMFRQELISCVIHCTASNDRWSSFLRLTIYWCSWRLQYR